MGKRSIYILSKMDCPTEERLVRMALDPVPGIQHLAFDLSARRVSIWHDGPVEHLSEKIQSLNLGAKYVETSEDVALPEAFGASNSESRTLKIVLAINAVMFVVELSLGLVAQSTGLIADSLDMFSDAAVYSVSLFAVSRTVALQKRSARISGILQIILALGALFEVCRRFFYGSEPESLLIILTSIAALAANVACLKLLRPHQAGGAHMKASVIFSTNDVVANVGVILSGILIHFFSSRLPDLIVGLIISIVVLKGGIKILKISK